MATTEHYVPALKYRFLTPVYDPLLKFAMREDIFKTRLVEQAHFTPGMRVLDLGCGTATLTIKVKQMHPQVVVFGVDGDPQVLEIARKKVAQRQLDISLGLGMAYALPYPNEYFDRVISSMVMHHLSAESKSHTMAEIQRVLKPGGEFHMVDFGKPASHYARITARVMRNFEDVEDNISGKLIDYMRAAAFQRVDDMGQSATFFGTLTFYRAVK